MAADNKPFFESSVNEALVGAIQHYMDHHPKTTIANLAKKCGLAESTLRRMFHQKTKTLPDPANVVTLLLFINHVSSIQQLLQKIDGPLKKFILEKYEFLQTGQNLGTPHSSDFLDHALKDKIRYLVYTLASHRGGVSGPQVKQIAGELGLSALNYFVENHILIHQQDHYLVKDQNYLLPKNRFVENFKTTADLIDVDAAKSNHSNLFMIVDETINETAYLELIHIQREAILKMAKVWNDPKSFGDIHFFFLTALDQMLRTKNK
jgi:AraC-like DNA-binding protein